MDKIPKSIHDDIEAIRDALIIDRALAAAGRFYSIEEAIADYEAATGVQISPEDLMQGIEDSDE